MCTESSSLYFLKRGLLLNLDLASWLDWQWTPGVLLPGIVFTVRHHMPSLFDVGAGDWTWTLVFMWKARHQLIHLSSSVDCLLREPGGRLFWLISDHKRLIFFQIKLKIVAHKALQLKDLSVYQFSSITTCQRPPGLRAVSEGCRDACMVYSGHPCPVDFLCFPTF